MPVPFFSQALGTVLGLGLFIGVCGCVETNSFVHLPFAAPNVPACQVIATWYPEVIFTPDPAHGGAPSPGIAGRMYLFGPEISSPLIGDGCVVVDMFDKVPAGQSATENQAPLEEWRLDRETLKRLYKPDALGSGYTLFLPWGTYKPEITQVHLRLRYEPASGTPLYNDTPAVTLKKGSSSSWQYSQLAGAQPPAPQIKNPATPQAAPIVAARSAGQAPVQQ